MVPCEDARWLVEGKDDCVEVSVGLGGYLDRVMRGRTFDNAVDVDLVYRVLGG